MYIYARARTSTVSPYHKNYTLSYCLDDDDVDTVWTLIITIIIIIHIYYLFFRQSVQQLLLPFSPQKTPFVHCAVLKLKLPLVVVQPHRSWLNAAAS